MLNTVYGLEMCLVLIQILGLNEAINMYLWKMHVLVWSCIEE